MLGDFRKLPDSVQLAATTVAQAHIAQAAQQQLQMLLQHGGGTAGRDSPRGVVERHLHQVLTSRG